MKFLATVVCGLACLLPAVGCGQKENSEKGAARDGGGLGDLEKMNAEKEKAARAKAKTIGEACQIYELNHGQKPAALPELTDAKANGGKPLLMSDALVDPWGQPFQFDPNGARNGGKQPDVWCVSPEGKMIGNWE